MKATFIRKRDDGWRGDARHYRLSQPMHWTMFDGDAEEIVHATTNIVVSRVFVPGQGFETYIFAADEFGSVTSWLDLPGSQKGNISHEGLLEALGWVIKNA